MKHAFLFSSQFLMESIPFTDYTSRSGGGGAFNLATSLPAVCCAPDMGPKMFIAYGSRFPQNCLQKIFQQSKNLSWFPGSPNEPSVGSTNLHIDMSDAVNILLFACSADDGEPKDSNGSSESQHQRALRDEVFKFGGFEAVQRLDRGEKAGAVWNIFNTNDNIGLRKFLR